METLFPDSETFVKDRPTKLTPNQEKEFYERMAKEVIQNGWTEYDQEVNQVAKDLQELSSWQNGFEKAKEIEDEGYYIDVEFVEWLESFDSRKRSVLRDTVKKWVKAHSVKPNLEVGQKLQSKVDKHNHKKGDILFVSSIHENDATYSLNPKPDEWGGIVLTYEFVEENYIKL